MLGSPQSHVRAGSPGQTWRRSVSMGQDHSQPSQTFGHKGQGRRVSGSGMGVLRFGGLAKLSSQTKG